MLFSSPVFLGFFLPITLFFYFLRPLRRWVLLICSLAFYSWGEPVMVVLLLFVIVMNYVFGLWINQLPDKRQRSIVLQISVGANIMLLIIFKYTPFIVENINTLLSNFNVANIPVPHITLPLGISFFTFQAISYLIDIYRNEIEPEKNLVNLAVFTSFFPQLIAGPIVRYREISEDLHKRRVSVEGLSAGFERFTIGLGKKLLIADPLSVPVDQIFAMSPADLSSPLAWLGLLSFALQIYFDFSGYSDMAIGLGMMFGFRFPENFNHPYMALDVQDFWRRWHMTLSRWFRDYLYIPLGGNQRGPLRTYLNLGLVFAVTGLWHGASWTFLVWGFWHGIFLCLERTAFGKTLHRAAPAPLRLGYTLFIVLLGWVWFRASDLDHALGFMQALFLNGLDDPVGDIFRYYNPFILSIFVIAAAIAFNATTWLEKLVGGRAEAQDGPGQLVTTNGQAVMRALGLSALALAVFAAASASTLQAFIYFRF